MIGFYLIACHLCGDFLLQNHWMQTKAKSSWVCTVHVLCYGLPFHLLVWLAGFPWVALMVILLEHWIQDRTALHLKWMRAFEQTDASIWPVGPLCMDQSMHIVFIAIVTAIAYA